MNKAVPRSQQKIAIRRNPQNLVQTNDGSQVKVFRLQPFETRRSGSSPQVWGSQSAIFKLYLLNPKPLRQDYDLPGLIFPCQIPILAGAAIDHILSHVVSKSILGAVKEIVKPKLWVPPCSYYQCTHQSHEISGIVLSRIISSSISSRCLILCPNLARRLTCYVSPSPDDLLYYRGKTSLQSSLFPKS